MNSTLKAIVWPLLITSVLCLFGAPWGILAMVLVSVLVGVLIVVIADYLL